LSGFDKGGEENTTKEMNPDECLKGDELKTSRARE
jgi:hypothetical protein